jgi:hypothetical protein
MDGGVLGDMFYLDILLSSIRESINDSFPLINIGLIVAVHLKI